MSLNASLTSANLKVHNVFSKVSFHPSEKQKMEKTRKFQIVYVGLCQHFPTDLARGIMTNKRKQSALSKA